MEGGQVVTKTLRGQTGTRNTGISVVTKEGGEERPSARHVACNRFATLDKLNFS